MPARSRRHERLRRPPLFHSSTINAAETFPRFRGNLTRLTFPPDAVGPAGGGSDPHRIPKIQTEESVTTLQRWVALAACLAIGLTAAEGGAQEPVAQPEEQAAEAEEVKGKLEGMSEQLQTLQADTDKLKKFKFSGYVQARWETGEAQSDTIRVSVSGTTATFTPANNARFYIRRARLKLTYDSSPLSQAVVYFDGGTDRTVRLLEAYVTLLDPWTPAHRHALTIGQMNVPFGYEIERSSSVRELPERSRAENVLFSGERDRGLKIVSHWMPQLETVLGVYNGGGVNNADFPTTDPTAGKDFLARARYSQGKVDGAVSYYGGRHATPLTGPDVETDKTRLGFDLQAFYELPSLGGGSLKGEFFGGHEINPDSVRTLTTITSGVGRYLVAGVDPSHLATDFLGGYVMWVQNLGEKFQFAARYDMYDPNDSVDGDSFKRGSIGLNWFYDGFTRISVAYDDVRTHASSGSGRLLQNLRLPDPKDNLLTVQFQHKF